MKERPILFSGEMVRAILDGRKAQTRRTVKGSIVVGDPYCPPCPYGAQGCRLWVRETFAYTDQHINYEPGWVYRATDPDWSEMEGFKWKPSIFMPRAASRITLEVERISVERLQDITEEDARAEGVTVSKSIASDRVWPQYKDAYKVLWESINGEGSWAKNPWVWVVEFKKL